MSALVEIKKINWPNIEPCRTPLNTATMSETSSVTRNIICQRHRKASTQCCQADQMEKDPVLRGANDDSPCEGLLRGPEKPF